MKTKAIFIIVSLFIFTQIFVSAAYSFEDEYDKKGFYFGLGLGTAKTTYGEDGDTFEELLEDEYGEEAEIDTSFIGAAKIELGYAITPKFLIGIQSSATYEEGDVSEISYEQGYTNLDNEVKESIMKNDIMLTLTFFPFKKGFFIKGGAGISKAKIEEEETYTYTYSSMSYSYTDEHTEKHDTDLDGKCYMVGLGYDFITKQSFNMGLHIEYTKQTYDEADDNKLSEDIDSETLAAYLAFYWY